MYRKIQLFIFGMIPILSTFADRIKTNDKWKVYHTKNNGSSWLSVENYFIFGFVVAGGKFLFY